MEAMKSIDRNSRRSGSRIIEQSASHANHLLCPPPPNEKTDWSIKTKQNREKFEQNTVAMKMEA
jgi:hypothetical protein